MIFKHFQAILFAIRHKFCNLQFVKVKLAPYLVQKVTSNCKYRLEHFFGKIKTAMKFFSKRKLSLSTLTNETKKDYIASDCVSCPIFLKTFPLFL